MIYDFENGKKVFAAMGDKTIVLAGPDGEPQATTMTLNQLVAFIQHSGACVSSPFGPMQDVDSPS